MKIVTKRKKRCLPVGTAQTIQQRRLEPANYNANCLPYEQQMHKHRTAAPKTAAQYAGSTTSSKGKKSVGNLKQDQSVTSTDEVANKECLFMPQITGLQDYQFRSELIRLMGSEEIRLNDQEWSKKFQTKLNEDYMRLLDEQEYYLAQAEKQRIHRLRVAGVTHESLGPDPNTLQAGPDGTAACGTKFSVSGGHGASGGGGKKKIKDGRGKRGDGSRETSGEFDGIPSFGNVELDQQERALFASRQQKIYHPFDDIQTQVATEEEKDRKKKMEEEEKERQEGTEKEDAATPLVAADIEEQKESIAKRRRKRYRHLPPSIARLYDEETIKGLYKLAHDLIGYGFPEPKKGVKLTDVNEES